MTLERRADQPCPANWRDILLNEVDFEKAFDALRGFEHFHSETLRGLVRMFQLRTKAAWKHLRRAEALYLDQRSQPEAEKHFFLLRLAAMDNALIDEVMDHGPGRICAPGH
jgi:hypothetical protein